MKKSLPRKIINPPKPKCPHARPQLPHKQARNQQAADPERLERVVVLGVAGTGGLPGRALAPERLDDEVGEDAGDVDGDESEDDVVPELGGEVATEGMSDAVVVPGEGGAGAWWRR